jgi:hypothetical protein
MFLDPDNQPPIDALIWHSLPDEAARPLQHWQIGTLVGTLYKNPPTRLPESLVALPYSLVVTRSHTPILVISLEMEDLRSLSLSLGFPLRQLQEEYQTKGVFGPVYGYLYTDERRESLGLYTESLTDEAAAAFLLEAVLDTFDLIDDPVLLEGEDEAAR